MKLPKLFKVNFDFDKWIDIYDEIEDKDKDSISDARTNHTPILSEAGNENIVRIKTLLKKYSIGDTEDVTSSYIFMETMAPAAYDGFSTMEISKDEKCSEAFIRDKPVRIVATENRDVAWQQGRYGSGMYYFKEINNE